MTQGPYCRGGIREALFCIRHAAENGGRKVTSILYHPSKDRVRYAYMLGQSACASAEYKVELEADANLQLLEALGVSRSDALAQAVTLTEAPL